MEGFTLQGFKSRNGTPPLTLFLTVRGEALLATPPATFRTVLLRPDISVRLALDIPFAHRGARSAPGPAAPKTALVRTPVCSRSDSAPAARSHPSSARHPPRVAIVFP